MPKALENKLKREARKKFKHIKDPDARRKRENAYTYGTLRETGWKPKREQ